jgi:hypothetical protein
MNKNFKNYANVDTVQTHEVWQGLSESERKTLIKQQLQKFDGAENFKVIQADKNGQIIISIEKNIPANERGMYLLGLEQTLKDNIDKGLHLWCEPVGDKSKLRNLRGVVINT